MSTCWVVGHELWKRQAWGVEQRVVISLELERQGRARGTDGAPRTTLCHQRRSAGGREQAEGLTPGAQKAGVPAERRAPMGVSLLCSLSLPGSRSSRGPGSPLLLSPGWKSPLRPKSPPSCFHPVGDTHPDVASSHPTRASIPPWNLDSRGPAPFPKARASRVDPPSLSLQASHPRLGGNQEPQVQELTAQSFISHHCGGGQCEIGVRAGLVPPEASLSGV